MFKKSLEALCLSIVLAAGSLAQSNKPSGLPRILPRDLEIELALSAGPKHLREDATVYVLAEEGYVKAKEGKNGFSCFVDRNAGARSGFEWIAPWCYDQEGMQTMGLVQFDKAKYRRQGVSEEEIRNKINAGFASGKYLVPRKSGVIYMLSPVNRVPDHRTGKLFDYVPHLMFYAPNITNEDLGITPKEHIHDQGYVLSGLPYLPVTGPHGFIVVPLGEKERAEVVAEHRDLIEKIRRYIDLDIQYK